MQVEFRTVQPEDLQQICEIEKTNYTHPWPDDVLEREVNQYTYCLVTGKTVIGYVYNILVLDECMIANVAVHTDYQNQGYGTMMMTKSIEALSKLGSKSFYLEVRESNTPAQKLYYKLGFCPIGLRKEYYNHPVEDAIVMAKIIASEDTPLD